MTRTCGESYDDFGMAAALSGNIALVGAYDAVAQYGQGYVYLYHEPSGGLGKFYTDDQPNVPEQSLRRIRRIVGN